MIFHENRLLGNIIPYFIEKLGKMSRNLSSAAVVIGALRVKACLNIRSNTIVNLGAAVV